MVGRDDQKERLLEDLTRGYSGEPKVIPIIGMGGIGKTTLAMEVYNDAHVRSHFDVCAWATLSQQHNVKEILLGLLRSTKGGTFDMNDEAELADMLHKGLYGKRCLVHVSKKSRDETKIISCKVHDLIYDLCLRQVQRGNLFIMNDILFEKSDEKKAQINDFVFDCDPNHVPSVCQSLSRHNMQPFKHWTGNEIDKFTYGLYRALLTPGHHQLRDDDNNNLLKRTRSIFFSGFFCSNFIFKSELIHFKLLKILDLAYMRIYSFPLQILSLIWLRYLALLCPSNFDIPPEICRLWNLQTFIVRGYTPSYITFPEQIWGLMQLRTYLSWSYLDVIAELPNLEVLKLMPNACRGEEWDPNV
ncbi:hypothetical protein MTR67_007580, partial [Solanum verrucosum]